jgi:TolA-binding protein
MPRRAISFWATLLLLAGLALRPDGSPAAVAPDEAAYQTGLNALEGLFYEKAEATFAQFATTFTNSPFLPAAVLWQAVARVKQTNYTGAVELLTNRMGSAGSRGDQYLLWLGEAYYSQGSNALAVQAFAKLIKDFPLSTNRLDAVIREARAYRKMSDWGKMAEILQATDGVFQTAVRTNAFAPEGYLLLSEAQLALSDFAGAQATLQRLRTAGLPPETSWQWQYLLCRIQLAAGQPGDALQGTTNLLMWAATTGQPALLAESINFRAGILERQGLWDEAISAYANNLGTNLPAGARRQALLRIIELCLAQNKVAEAGDRLEQLLGHDPALPAGDIGWQTLGELRLRQHSSTGETNGIYLAKARQAFGGVRRNFPQSPLLGKAELHLGWCFWLEENMPEAQRAFQRATEHLPASADHAFAIFKVADCEYKQNNFTNALRDYNAVVDKYFSLPEAQTNLIERALYQAVRAALNVPNLSEASSIVGKLLARYPTGYHTDRAVLLTGQEVNRQGDPTGARKIFSQLAAAAPNAPNLPEVQLAIGRTFQEEENWPEAIRLYEGWLGTFTNHPAQAQAEYYRAFATAKTGDTTNALRFYTNLVAHFPTNELAQLAQLWVGDYYFSQGGPENMLLAEKQYQILSLSSNYFNSDLPYRAEMMAGIAAKERQGWEKAKECFSGLAANSNCPNDLRLQARFEYANLLHGAANPKEDLEKAIQIFGSICILSNSPLAADAWGSKADCYLQYARFSHNYGDALAAYQQVTNFVNVDPAIRARAKVGEATVREIIAEGSSGAEKGEQQKQALNLYLDVLYDEASLRAGGNPYLLFWTKKAGREAGRLAESMQDWSHAIKIYERLKSLLPVLSAQLDKTIFILQEKLDAEQKTAQ